MLVVLQRRDCVGARVDAEISSQANKIQEKNDGLAREVAVRLKEKETVSEDILEIGSLGHTHELAYEKKERSWLSVSQLYV